MYISTTILFSTGVVNRGDSFRRRRSRSNSLAPADQENEERRRAPPKEVISYTVAMLGARGVGKTALISQFMTSECINAYDRQRGKSKRGSARFSICGYARAKMNASLMLTRLRRAVASL